MSRIRCSTACGGTPQCKIPTLNYNVRTVEISGQRASEIKLIREDDTANIKPNTAGIYSEGEYDLMIIGESPGIEEDRAGYPFVGSSSNYLFKFLEKAGIDLDRVFCTYIIRCLPLRQRKPTAGEIKSCIQHLRYEIEQIKPKVVMCLGNLSLKAFKLGSGITTIRGKVFEKKFVDWEDGPIFTVVPSINPAAFTWRQEGPELNRYIARVGSDYHVVASLLKGETLPNKYMPNWKLIDDIEKFDSMIEQIKEKRIFSFDTESPDNRFWNLENPLMCLSFAWGHANSCAVLPFYEHYQKEPSLKPELHFNDLWIKESFGTKHQAYIVRRLKEIFEDPTIAKIAFNAKYDINTVKVQLDIDVKGFIYDPMVMHHLLDEIPPHDLCFLADNEFGVGNYEEKRKMITGKGKKLINKFDKVPNFILWPYTCMDAECTFRLCFAYYTRLSAKPHLWNLYVEESEPGIHALAIPERRGSLMNKVVVQKLKDDVLARQKELLTNMRSQIRSDFNPLSPDMVVEAFKKLGLEDAIKEPTAAKGYKTDKKRLGELEHIPLAGDILEYRTNGKMISTYYNKALYDTDENGRMYYSFKQHGTVTGRLSASFVHQIPRTDDKLVLDKEKNYIHWEDRLDNLVIRDSFIAPPGYKYIQGDYSQVELRILAIIAKDLELQRVFEEGLDLHAITTAEILSVVWPGYNDMMAANDKFNRAEVGKRVNFGLAYGSQGHALVKTGKWMDAKGNIRTFTWDMLNEGMENWRARFKGVGEFVKNKPAEVRDWNRGIAINCFGRERRFGNKLESRSSYERGEAERECVNYFIQSAAGDITNRTINKVHQILNTLIEAGDLRSEDIYLVNTVHDSIAYECREELIDWFIPIFHNIAIRPIIELEGKSFPFDLGVGNSWTEAEFLEVNI